MPRASRLQCESNIYHVIHRGTGRQLIFEDDRDREHFLGLLHGQIAERRGELLAWCLMGNHVHLLMRMPLNDLSLAMMSVAGGYARFFNLRHDRIGHLFQDRFKSEPVDNEEYLLTVVRYIHANPQVAGIAPLAQYRWSSYREYIGAEMGAGVGADTETGAGAGVGASAETGIDAETPQITDTEFVLKIMGGVEQFKEFHRANRIEAPRLTDRGWTRELADEDAIGLAREMLGLTDLHDVAAMPKSQRNLQLDTLKRGGFTIRQIERLTGISRSVIARAL